MGDKFRTIQNLEIIKSDPENNLIYIKGSVPGSKNSIVLIKKNIKNIKRITTMEKIVISQKTTTKEHSKRIDKQKPREEKKINKKTTEKK